MNSPSLPILDRLVVASGLPAVKEVSLELSDGYGLDNRITVAQLFDGRRVVLRQSRVERRSPRMRVDFLRTNGIMTPTLYASDGEGSSLWEYVDGRPLADMVEAGLATDDMWANVGVALANVHSVTFPSPLQGDIGIDTVNLRPVDPLDDLHASLDGSAGWIALQHPQLVRPLADVRQFLTDRASDIRAARPSIAHGDVNLLNIVVRPDGTAQFIDWDFPAVRYPLSELSALDEHAYLHGLNGLPPSFFDGYDVVDVPPDLLLAYRIVGCVGWLSSDDWSEWEADLQMPPVARARLRHWHRRLTTWANSIPSRLTSLG